ncbi:23S rRNA pseudouridine1911/1915/1917 synthase [Paenibacillus phyllosphaerae]|uniref:Pseudouridine synthase n=1 Tax=Paenibacillus phyllosphaerae TaxID=274593 RepID=A0A7W5FLG8_9BACL|nr:RluA family pseudouridine synthase [Paenibacillus phyllosphaerae]MBB3109078.1 23S rRNA pseudouridine1911/1915/1917 synthase [Paenibacillus phyllosphaerae]
MDNLMETSQNDHFINEENGDEPIEFVVRADEAGERLDKFVTENMYDESISRTQVQDWIKNAAVLVNGRTVKPNYKLADGDTIVVTVPEPESATIDPENIPLDIIYEDSDVIVINKPRGMVVHPAPGHPSGTVVNALMYHCKDLSGINGVMRPGIVHRIDKDTSGLLMIAKNDLAHASLAAQLKVHSVNRRYVALVHGNVPHDNGTIDAPIGRDPKDRKLFTVTEKGSKHAVTHFTVMERFGDYTLMELQLETGRTHQIRVHMKYIGHPLAGDPVYGRSKTIALKGQALHAQVLGFTHPRSGEEKLFEAPIPADMMHEITLLRQS